VRGTNACGDGSYSSAFSFTTGANIDYFTEEFGTADSVDLAYTTISLVPNASIDYYEICILPASELPTDPNGATPITLNEDDSYNLVTQQSKTVEIYGAGYTSFWVNENGSITFDGPDDEYEEALWIHFNELRISALFNDLSVPTGGSVSWEQLDDRVAITFENVPEYDTTNSNTFQYELFFDGEIRITYLEIEAHGAIVGVSEGNGTPGDFVNSDLSSVAECLPECPGDITGDGRVGLEDLAQLLGHYGDTGASYEDGDLTGDGEVGLNDLAELLGLYGDVCW
jgi:hypothetical protein